MTDTYTLIYPKEANHSEQPTEQELRLKSVVKEALLQGIFYNSEMYDFVVKSMNDILSIEVLASGKDRIENGHFGMDIYYTRKKLERELIDNANQEAMSLLLEHKMIAVGQRLKNVSYGSNTFSSALVKTIDTEHNVIVFEGTKRGSKSRWGFSMTANDARLIELLTNEKHDLTVTSQTDGSIQTLVIDPTASRLGDFKCRLSFDKAA